MFTALQQSLRESTNKWVFQLRDSEPGEVFLNQRRVFIIPTPAGMMFGIMLIMLFIGSVNYNLSLGFALTFLLGGCGLIDMHLTFRNLAYLNLSAGRASTVFAGDEAEFELHLINRRKHSRFAICLGFAGEGLSDLAQAADVGGRDRRSVRLSVPAVERGWLPAPRVRLITRFPLGLFRAWSYWKPDAQALVYPHPEDGAPPLPFQGSEVEDGRGRAGHDDFAGVRAYQSGDSIKHLAWRQIAKVDSELGGNLVTKQFEGGLATDLCLDFGKLPRRMDLELRLSRMTRWVIEAETRGLAYSFRLGDTFFASSLGLAHQAACLRELAIYQEA